MRLRPWRLLSWLAAFGCLWLPVFDDPPLQTGAYVQNVTTTSACVAMMTAAPCQLMVRVTASDGRLLGEFAESSARRRHALTVTGLEAGREYAFTVIGAGRLADGRIRTPPPAGDDRAPVRFAALGDSGAVPWWVWLQRNALFHLPARWQWLPVQDRVAAIGERVAAAKPEFWLHLGDIVYPYGRSAHYSAGFFRPFAEVLASAPVYATLGNHDVLDDSGRQALAHLHLPDNEVTGDERCYSFGWGGLRVFVVDFNLVGGRDFIPEDHPSLVWLRRELGRHTEPWFAVASHFPIRSVSRQKDRPDLLAFALPPMLEHGVDLYLAGHDHTYQRFGDGSAADDLPMVVSGGGGKSLYEVTPGARAVVAQSAYHWCFVEIDGPRLRLRARGLDGGVLDTLELRKAAGERLERIRGRNRARAERIDNLVRG
ncbi:MAG: metallophosphoesterase [Planctomycetes bacterium]|nr:metallophosphoesterase [Planctomycetota bacterium]